MGGTVPMQLHMLRPGARRGDALVRRLCREEQIMDGDVKTLDAALVRHMAELVTQTLDRVYPWLRDHDWSRFVSLANEIASSLHRVRDWARPPHPDDEDEDDPTTDRPDDGWGLPLERQWGALAFLLARDADPGPAPAPPSSSQDASEPTAGGVRAAVSPFDSMRGGIMALHTGLGKSYVALAAARIDHDAQPDVGPMLLIAKDKHHARDHWSEQIRGMFPGVLNAVVLSKRPPQQDVSRVRVVILPREALQMNRRRVLVDWLCSPDRRWSRIIVDEAHGFKNCLAECSMGLRTVVKAHAGVPVWLLTATPMDNGSYVDFRTLLDYTSFKPAAAVLPPPPPPAARVNDDEDVEAVQAAAEDAVAVDEDEDVIKALSVAEMQNMLPRMVYQPVNDLMLDIEYRAAFVPLGAALQRVNQFFCQDKTRCVTFKGSAAYQQALADPENANDRVREILMMEEEAAVRRARAAAARAEAQRAKAEAKHAEVRTVRSLKVLERAAEKAQIASEEAALREASYDRKKETETERVRVLQHAHARFRDKLPPTLEAHRGYLRLQEACVRQLVMNRESFEPAVDAVMSGVPGGYTEMKAGMLVTLPEGAPVFASPVARHLYNLVRKPDQPALPDLGGDEPAWVRGLHPASAPRTAEDAVRADAEANPDFKFIFFSRLKDECDSVYDLLTHLGVPCVKLHSDCCKTAEEVAEALRQFKRSSGPDAYRGLICTERIVGESHNLQVASHVFISAPLMNPCKEVQAIGRVAREGQRNKVVITFLCPPAVYVQRAIEKQQAKLQRIYQVRRRDTADESEEDDELDGAHIEDIAPNYGAAINEYIRVLTDLAHRGVLPAAPVPTNTHDGMRKKRRRSARKSHAVSSEGEVDDDPADSDHGADADADAAGTDTDDGSAAANVVFIGEMDGDRNAASNMTDQRKRARLVGLAFARAICVGLGMRDNVNV